MSRIRLLSSIVVVFAGFGLVALWLFRGGPPSPAAELVSAVQRGDEKAVRTLLKAGVNPDSMDRAGNAARVRAWFTHQTRGHSPIIEHGRTALGWSALYGKERIARLLVDHGANLTAFDRSGRSPIHWGAISGSSKVVELLLDSGVAIELPSLTQPGGGTPLILAAANGRTETVKLLLSRGAKVNARAADGRTALIWAARHGNPDIVRHLMAAGADPKVKDNAGYTTLTSSRNQGRLDLEQTLSKSLSLR